MTSTVVGNGLPESEEARRFEEHRRFSREVDRLDFNEGSHTGNELGQFVKLQHAYAELLEEHAKLRQKHIELADERGRLSEKTLHVKSALRLGRHGIEIIGESPALRTVLKQIQIVAPTCATVLIQGETGTGKELVAQALHTLSLRRERALIKVNCAAIPSGLLESELFGHEKGAFTGAIARKMGRFELADQSTIFLDEVADIPPELQPKLLRVLQEQEFERLGSSQTHEINVRIVAATSRDLSYMVAEKQFRSDLYYRLNVFPIRVPSLRERADDIPMLVRYFVDKYSRQFSKCIQTIDENIMDILRRHSWPGNIRELQNFIERAVILSRGKALEPPLGDLEQALPHNGHNGHNEHNEHNGHNGNGNGNHHHTNNGASPEATTLEECERAHILRVLAQTRWVVGGRAGAAAILGLKRTTLISKMKKLGINPRQHGTCVSE
jgi:formate hydrogenlyase transcriptional activator